MFAKTCFCFILLASKVVDGISNTNDAANLSVPQGFPVTWYGDEYNHTDCQIVSQIPSYLDGYFFCETGASYGDQNNPYGQKLIHMFDGISAVGLFDINPFQSTFSGAYYPTESYKVWDLYSRDMTQSTVGWLTNFSPWNNSRKHLFDSILLSDMHYNNGQPNVDFWKIGHTIVTGTEAYGLGLTFDVPTLTDFKPYPFNESNNYFGPGGDPDVHYLPIHMAIHERTDLATGLLWNSVFALKQTAGTTNIELHELVYNVDPNGNRVIVGDYKYAFNESQCDFHTGIYSGNASTLPGYMHSTTSTENYFIMPLTSMVFNPCTFSPFRPIAGLKDIIWDPSPPNNSWAVYQLNLGVNMRFLLYDKRDGSFRMINHNFPYFITHQFNAYEVNDTMLYVDMVVFDDSDYSGLELETLLNVSSIDQVPGSHLYRFTIDLLTNKTTNTSLLPVDNLPLEFPQFNHHYEGLKYRWSYLLYGGYIKNSSIWKIDVDDATGANNLIWNAGFDISLSEPYFVARPDATSEDDGVLVVRGLDVSINKTRVFVVDALTMTKIGEIIAPEVVPFGFHNRYYSKADLNLPPTPPITPITCTTEMQPATTTAAATIVQTVNFITLLMMISCFVRFSFL